MKNYFKTHKHRPESIEKNRLAHIGKSWGKHTEEAKKKIALVHLGKPRSIETKLKLHIANIGKHQSIETKKKISFSEKGDKHWNWKGGISKDHDRGNLWNIIRKNIYKRDNWTCQICFKHCHNDIQCHHIVPYRATQDNSESNLITLCKSCHVKEEHKYYRNLKGQMELF